MDNDQLNAATSDAAHFRMLWDGGLAWICGPNQMAPLCFLDTGALILRRWPGQKHPRPLAPCAIGFALRPATVVDESDGVTADADTIYWVDVDRISAGGVIDGGTGRNAQPAVYDGGAAYVGPIPNPPQHVTLRQGPDGKLWISWVYNPVDQQVAPDSFKIYSDSGGGTLNGTPLASVDYVPGKRHYSYRLSSDAWDGWQFLVLAETATAEQSLAALPHGRGLSSSYGLDAADAVRTGTRLATQPTAPAVAQSGSQSEGT